MVNYRTTTLLTRQMHDSLRTTGVGLGLMRLQLDAGMAADAHSTLVLLQQDFQLLLHAFEEELKSLPAEPPARGLESCKKRVANLCHGVGTKNG